MKHILSIVTVTVLLALSGCGEESETVTATGLTNHELVLEKVEMRGFNREVWLPGQVVATHQISIASKISGHLRTIAVDEGDRVLADQVLAEIDGTGVEQAITQAQAEIDSARANLKDAQADVIILRKLSETQLLAEDQLRNAEVRETTAFASLQKAMAALKTHEADRAYITLLAPEDAVVVERVLEPGELAINGSTILRLESLSSREIEVFVPASIVNKISVGQSLPVRLHEKELIPSRVLAIVPSADPVTRQVKIRLATSEATTAIPGSYAEAQLITDEDINVAVPIKVIINRAGITGVFIVDDKGQARFRSVRLGHSQKGYREVLAGLDADTTIVTEPTRQLRDGDRVSQQ